MNFLARRWPPHAAALGVATALCACAPALDWREVRAEGSGLRLQMPCKPSGQSRDLALAGQTVNLKLLACSSAGHTWGLAFADVADPVRLGPALAALRAAAAANLGATAPATGDVRVPGATPHPASGRQRLQGHLPGGKRVHMEVALFAHGTVVYQASVLGEALDEEAVQVFLSALRFGP
ncbi:MAG TPA: hypothetical protein PLL92_08940 [Alicycliphilus sp.]|nr:hypothetical protein [Alicycliphilus sp.]